MGIHDNKSDNGQQGKQGGSQMETAFERAGIGSGARDQAAPAGEQTSRARRSGNADLTAASINTHFRRSFSRAPTSQAVVEYEKAFAKSLEENIRNDADYPVQYAIRSIDSNDNQDVGIGCILVLGAFEQAGKKNMVVSVLLVAGSVPAMPVQEKQVPGRNKPIELQMTAGDYAVDTLWAAIVTKLQQIYGQDYTIQPAGNFTLPAQIDPTKDGTIIRESLFNAMGAVDTYIERNFAIGAEPLTVQVVTNKAQTSIVMDLSDVPGIDATGLPVRSDISMTLRSAVRGTSTAVPDRVIDVVRLAGFVNLVYTMPPAPTSVNQRPDTRRFTPQLVLTSLQSETNLITPETQLLALAMAPILQFQDQYLATLMPSATQRNPMRDFGAVGYEVNLSGSDDGRPVGKEDLTKMSTGEIFQMARMSLFDDLHVALVINESGPQTWMNSLFLDAALPNGGAAYDTIIEAANNLTGGIFGQVFQGGPIANLTGTRQHMGFYRDQHDEVRDLLDIDALWMYNKCGAKNPEMVYDFIDTYLGNDDPDAQLADRWAIIQRLVTSATLVSYGQIVEVDPNFLTALMTSVKQAGLSLRANNNLVDFNNARGRASYQGGAGLNSQVIGAALNTGGGDNRRTGGPGYGGLGMNRWTRK